ncbi:hypothetical protein ACFL0D_06540 [Thermoproteota archaeon]
MSGVFTRKSSQLSSLFRYYPGAVYEFQDRVWRVKSLTGNAPASLFRGSSSINRLFDALEEKGLTPENLVVPITGKSELWPKTWVCSNPSCRRFEVGNLSTLDCSTCRSEFRQMPFVVVCDNCGYLAEPTFSKCNNHPDAYVKREWPNLDNLYSLKLVCSTCGTTVYSDFNIGARCPSCRENNGKRISPATASTIINPLHMKTFDEDISNIITKAHTSLSRELKIRDMESILDEIRNVFHLDDIYLSNISVLQCTYGYKVGNNGEKYFQNNTIYLRDVSGTAAVFKFKSDISNYNVLHSASHALLHPAGYITGLGSNSFNEYIDEENQVVMIFSTEPGACDVLVREPIKTIQWLKRAKFIVKNCKNQCENGCPWCLHTSNIQCSEFNNNLDRRNLARIWNQDFLLGEGADH